MRLAKVEGKVVCPVLDKSLRGVKLYIIQPLDRDFIAVGPKIIATDGVGSEIGQTVVFVSSREGALCIPGVEIPSDAGIVAIVEH
jgi:microcompartment protein CcmK/EutM